MFGGGYEWIRQLYASAATEVHIVRHIRLDEERILKVIHRNRDTFADQTVIHPEAEILRGLRHPGIPILFDYGEDDESICLIEEYVRGPSLQEYFREHTSITVVELSYLMSRLCDILDYLHSQPTPILYQDLKPEHIIMRGGEPVLIDYGISSFLGMTNCSDIYGTEGYLAPELLSGSAPHKLSDVYSLGVVAHYLSEHCDDRLPGQMSNQILLAMSRDPGNRPASVGEWKTFWDACCRGATGSDHGIAMHSPARIAVCCSYPGTGCTHIAISLVTYLIFIGKSAYYIDRCGVGVVERIYENCREFREKKGLIYHSTFRGLRCYETHDGSRNSINYFPYNGICVMDCGRRNTPVPDADITLFVAGSAPWKRGAVPECFVSADHCYLLVNPASAGACFAFAKDTGRRAYGFPLDPDPFRITDKKRRLFSAILSGERL